MSNKRKRAVYRSAKTGRFVSKAYAEKFPWITYLSHVKVCDEAA